MSSHNPAFLLPVAISSARTRHSARPPSTWHRSHVARRGIRATAQSPSPTSAAWEESPCVGHDCSVVLDDKRIAYDYFPGKGPAVIFLPGFFDSRYRQAKANAITIFARRAGQAVLVEEYAGIGNSEGDFITEGTMTRWVRDTIDLLDHVLPDEKLVLVGAGIGGWIMLHVAMRLPHRVVGLVGVNPSVDFTQDLLAPNLTDTQKEDLEKTGSINMTWGFRKYVIGKAFMEDAQKWLVLDGEPGGLDVQCPVRLLQGMRDEEIPPERVLKLAQHIRTEDVVLQFVKYGNHVMDEEEDLERMWSAVFELSDKYFEYDLTSPGSG